MYRWYALSYPVRIALAALAALLVLGAVLAAVLLTDGAPARKPAAPASQSVRQTPIIAERRGEQVTVQWKTEWPAGVRSFVVFAGASKQDLTRLILTQPRNRTQTVLYSVSFTDPAARWVQVRPQGAKAPEPLVAEIVTR